MIEIPCYKDTGNNVKGVPILYNVCVFVTQNFDCPVYTIILLYMLW